jgi:phospholipid transport system substrate-binding protein
MAALHVCPERWSREPKGATSKYHQSRYRSSPDDQKPGGYREKQAFSATALLTRFDFAAMAQQSLGNRWSELNAKEAEFVSAFTDFVENGYMSTLGSYRGEKVVYDRDWVDGEAAEVDTRVVGGEGAPIKIGYKLHLTGGQWMVYDAVIDDVSAVANYRSQFTRILRTASLEELIQRLRANAFGR